MPRKSQNEPTKRFMQNAFEAAKAAGWSSIRITTPYGSVTVSDGEIDEREENSWEKHFA